MKKKWPWLLVIDSRIASKVIIWSGLKIALFSSTKVAISSYCSAYKRGLGILVVNASRTSFFCLSSFVSDSLPLSVLLIFLFLLLSWLVSMLFFQENSFLPSVLWTSDWGEYFIICFQLSLLMYLVGLNSRYMTIVMRAPRRRKFPARSNTWLWISSHTMKTRYK